jgi:hypothetical protein
MTDQETCGGPCEAGLLQCRESDLLKLFMKLDRTGWGPGA